MNKLKLTIIFILIVSTFILCGMCNTNKDIFYSYIPEGSNICFIGDSVTFGDMGKNGWYSGLELDKYNVASISVGGIGVNDIYRIVSEDYQCLKYARKSDYFVIAIGANDLRWSKMAKTNGNKFVSKIDMIIKTIGTDKKYIIVSPWFSFEESDETQATVDEKNALNKEICNKLEKYCDDNGYLFANTFSILKQYSENNEKYYRSMLKDFIHPNNEGNKFYSDVFIKSLNKKYFQ